MRSTRRRAATAAALIVVVAALAAGALALRPPPEPAPALDPAALEARLTEALAAIYAAFGEEDEARIYDRLESAAAGDLVADLYLQRRAAQVADHAEDGETDVTAVEPFRIDAAPLEPGPGYRVDAAWRVVGRVRHRTHVHERINLYAAELTLEPVDGAWKLTGFTLQGVDRATDLGFEGGE